ADSTRVVEVQPSPPPPPLQDPPGAEAAGSGRPVVADSQKAEAPLDAERLALETPQDVSPRILERRSEIPIELAEASPQVGESPRAPSPTPRGNPTSDPLDSAPLEEILLAALTDLPLPDYAPPAGAGSLGWMRQFGPVRSGVTSYRVETRAPADHAGLTLDESPRLWWFVAEAIDLPLQVTLVDEEAIDPLLQIELPGPHGPGLQSIDLEEHGIRLEPETEYRWFVSVLVDPNRPSRNPASAGALRVIGDSDERRRGIEETAASARGHTLARLGIWYDAYDFFASLAAAHPQIEGLAAHRDRLVEMAAAGR
ncbi:MAG: hypothetical protein CL908_21065, partial [Deltaproteobacteria bacterium]|nr:hypothetical protein [Deltaproteobacteria bacterium]